MENSEFEFKNSGTSLENSETILRNSEIIIIWKILHWIEKILNSTYKTHITLIKGKSAPINGGLHIDK